MFLDENVLHVYWVLSLEHRPVNILLLQNWVGMVAREWVRGNPERVSLDRLVGLIKEVHIGRMVRFRKVFTNVYILP